MAKRTVIVGAPKTGKSTIAARMGRKSRCTDDVRNEKSFSRGTSRVASWMDEDSYLIEGCVAAHGLRKWMHSNAGKPCDEVVYLERPRSHQTPRQKAMGKGIKKVFSEIEPELRRRGVSVSRR